MNRLALIDIGNVTLFEFFPIFLANQLSKYFNFKVIFSSFSVSEYKIAEPWAIWNINKNAGMRCGSCIDALYFERQKTAWIGEKQLENSKREN